MEHIIDKASPPLQLFGLLLSWVGSLLPFMFTWARFGSWVSVAGVLLFLMGLFLAVRATRQVSPDDPLEHKGAGSKSPIGELTHRRTVVFFCVALGISVAVSSLWYAGGSSGPLKLAAAQRDALTTHANIVLPAFFAFFIGVSPGAFGLQKTVLLTVLLGAAGGAVHWVAGRWGIQVDWPTADGSMMLALLKVLFMLPVTMPGFLVGKAFKHIAQRAERPTIRSYQAPH